MKGVMFFLLEKISSLNTREKRPSSAVFRRAPFVFFGLLRSRKAKSGNDKKGNIEDEKRRKRDGAAKALAGGTLYATALLSNT